MKTFKEIPDKWFYLLIIPLAAYFIYRLIDQSKILFIFPLDLFNDYQAHMAHIYFLAKYGYHQLVPLWYNGFILFQQYPPAYYFFVLPIYFLTKNVQVTIFTSVILMFIIIFITLFAIGKYLKFSKTKIIAFFLILFANPISIGNFIRLGRVTEMFGWLNFFILAFILFYYKDRKIDKKFILFFVPFYFLLILSHFVVIIIFHVLLLSLFLIKKPKEKIIMIISTLLGLALSSFWWIPFLKSLSNTNIVTDYHLAERLLMGGPWLLKSIASFIIPPIFLLIFYFYWIKEKNKKELLFYLPILLISILLFFRIVTFIPPFNYIYPDIYLLFILFFASILLFKIDFNKLSPTLKKFLFCGFIVITIISITISLIHTPKFITHTKLDKEILSLLPEVKGKFFVLGDADKPAFTYYSYGAIFYNLSTPTGAGTFWVMSRDYRDILSKNIEYFENKNCLFLNTTKQVNASTIISYDKHCNFIESCGLTSKIKKEHACLFYLSK